MKLIENRRKLFKLGLDLSGRSQGVQKTHQRMQNAPKNAHKNLERMENHLSRDSRYGCFRLRVNLSRSSEGKFVFAPIRQERVFSSNLTNGPEGATRQVAKTSPLTDRPADRPTDRPTGRPTDRPTERTTGRPTNRPTDRRNGRPARRPTVRRHDRPTNQLTDRLTDRPVGW